MSDFLIAPVPLTTSQLPVIPEAVREGEALANWARDIMWTASADAPRSRQTSVGPSELGLACTRQLAYRLAGTAPVNVTADPLPSIVGTALHAWMAETFRALRPPTRYLVEHPISYRDIQGTLDLYDRRTQTVVDWKFPRLSKARRMRVDGPPVHYRWQLQTYAAGLLAQGETPIRNAVVCIPHDGSLADAFAWVFAVDTAEADEAVDRLSTAREQLGTAGEPGSVPKQPSRLCPWCPFHRAGWTGDPNTACCGDGKAK